MSTTQQREVLHNYLDNADSRFINLVYAMMQADIKSQKGEIIGYTAQGDPLTPEEYRKGIDEARNQIKAGEFMTQEELEKRSENW